MQGIMKIVRYLEESGLLIKSVSEATLNEAREQIQVDSLACFYVH